MYTNSDMEDDTLLKKPEKDTKLPRYTIKDVFQAAVTQGASDIYLTPHNYPLLRVKDQFIPLTNGGDTNKMTPAECDELVLSSMNPEQRTEFIREKDFDFGLDLKDVGRFRVNVYFANGAMELVARHVNGKPIPLEKLRLPDVITDIAKESKTGLILVTGATGSGKTNTLAGIIDHMNRHSYKKIVTIEDPIEIVHESKKSSISQRELYDDTKEFHRALRAAMRQRPDVILIGEMRDAETVNTAIGASESGHLVLSTLHSVNAQETISRVLDFYPQEEQQQIRNLLAATLRAVISQKLIVDDEGNTRALVEVLREDMRIADAIRDPDKTHELSEIMEQSTYMKMQTFDSHLIEMVEDGVLSSQRAEGYSENPTELHKKLKYRGLIY